VTEQVKRKPRIAVWISAFRLHTLPLAVASIALGTLLAYNTHFKASIAVFSFVTAVLLQILSNLANDYGDTKHGADTDARVGPKRMVHSGEISNGQIKSGIVIVMILSLISGIILLVSSIDNIGYTGAMILFLVGIFAIVAAVAYTATPKPYGYMGLGDISVFLFFGVVAVVGSYFLQVGVVPPIVWLPAFGMGMLCTAVLNINNMRDIESDGQTNKNTIPVKIGLRNAKIYHWILLMVPLLLFGVYGALINPKNWPLFIAPGILFFRNGWAVSASKKAEDLAPLLKQLSISIFFFALFFGTCCIMQFFN
jgi:1,4-dihydroxy-2-naphthoate octaprenyltransferase